MISIETVITDKLLAAAYISYLYKWCISKEISIRDLYNDEYIGDVPTCMDEFFSNEFQDKEIISHYLNSNDMKLWEKYFEDTE